MRCQRVWLLAVSAVLGAGLAACGSSHSSSGSTSSSMTSSGKTTSPTTNPQPSTTTTAATGVVPKMFFSFSGSGSKSSSAVTPPQSWHLQWKWTCQTRKQAFQVVATKRPQDAKNEVLVSQDGYAGGGARRFNLTGPLVLEVNTGPACTWTVSVAQ